ncbi:hypothetical protein H3146_27715, partial [Streptomyces sp. OF3]|nr:hypothetical protein [Streptomyces alkaliterrae]
MNIRRYSLHLALAVVAVLVLVAGTVLIARTLGTGGSNGTETDPTPGPTGQADGGGGNGGGNGTPAPRAAVVRLPGVSLDGSFEFTDGTTGCAVIRNDGGVPVTLTRVSVVNAGALGACRTENVAVCTATPVTLAPSGRCAVAVRILPSTGATVRITADLRAVCHSLETWPCSEAKGRAPATRPFVVVASGLWEAATGRTPGDGDGGTPDEPDGGRDGDQRGGENGGGDPGGTQNGGRNGGNGDGDGGDGGDG